MLNAEHIYVALLFRASSKYPSWDPEIKVNVGDYGHFATGRPKPRRWFWRKPQGIFVKKGNIYEDGLAEKYNIPDARIYGSSSSEGATWIISKGTEQEPEASSTEDEGETQVLQNCVISASFRFASKQGAVLAMENDSVATIDPPSKLRPLLNEPSMQHAVLVSEVHTCTSYARYLGSPHEKGVSIGLQVVSPTSGAVEWNTTRRWICNTTTGDFKWQNDMQRTYFPLFRLVSLSGDDISPGSPGEGENGDMPLPDAIAPWMKGGALDDSLLDEADKKKSGLPCFPFGSFRLRR